ncbi:MAG: hypothetical protein AB8G23_07825 [Myxococcota bacterium]
MTHDPLRRRFGHGAARLPIGTSTKGPSLSQLAQRPVAGERLFAGGPAGVCFAFALTLFFAVQLDFTPEETTVPRELAPQFAEREEVIPPLTLEFWDEAPREPAATVPTITPEPVVIAEASKAIPAPPTPQASPQPAEPAPVEDTSPRVPFDPTQLVLGAPPKAPLGDPLLSNPAPTPPRAASRRPSARARTAPRPRINLPTRGENAPGDLLTAANAATATAPAARPRAGRPGGSTTVRTPGWSTDTDQRAFLTAQANEQNRSRGTGPSGRDRLSPVSASAETRAKAERIRDELSAGGWQQVPLDTLPDCSPPGRQDELKRSILRAAAYQPTCTDARGSFKFIETRNLGAFLMWSRTSPEAFAQTGRDRDACVVLERALRCLRSSSN